MVSAPIVSVIIPAYNAARFLGATIQSVQQQTFQDWELLIIDDGSSDETATIASSYQVQDDRITLISQPNQGVSAARNLGVARSQGEIIAFLDADDQWLPTKLSQHLTQFQTHPQLGVGFAQVEFLTPAGEPTGQISSSRLTNLQPIDVLAENPTTTTSNWVLRRQVFEQVGGFCLDMSYSEDLEWLLRVRCTTTWQMAGLAEVLTRYRTSTGGLSADLYRMEAGWNLLVEKARVYAPEVITQYFGLAQAVHLRYLARRSLRLTLPATVGVDFINRALRSDWQLIRHQPKRTLLTLVAVYLRYLLSKLGLTARSRSPENSPPINSAQP
uniref:Glycosyl transferase family 2 n=1 Tax=Cyanothece sp. (strain PCC 7425 / ATCC 29141) TaxID=395961 RepID=B8HJT1_CYAP4